MTSHSLLPRFFPAFFFLSLALLSLILHFNGLYGQDAHEYLRQSREIFDRLQGLPAPSPELGDTPFAVPYPLVGALMQFLPLDAVLALQLVSWLAAAAGLWVFERLLALLAPGARTDSRWAFAGLSLALCPFFIRAGLSSMSDGLGLLFALSAFFFGLRAWEQGRGWDILVFTVFAAWAMSVQYALAALMLPLGLILCFHYLDKRKWAWMVGALMMGVLALLPQLWLKTGELKGGLGYSALQDWSPANFFHHTFSNENGLANYPLPNILYLLYIVVYPGFCLLLPGLFFLFKKTDLTLSGKKMLFGCILAYLLLLGGLPHQNLQHLLPAYLLLLLLLFPAWDRLYCYGFLFFRRMTMGILIGAIVVQLLFTAKYMVPLLSRNRLEQTVATQLKPVLPSQAILYAFDLDVSLHSYLRDIQFRNLCERRYTEYPKGSFVLFNESLRPQWQGRNPELNWDDLQQNHVLVLRTELPEGWRLWEIR